MSSREIIYDGYGNIVTKLGTSKDKSRGNAFFERPRIDHDQLSAMYEGAGLSARIVDLLPDAATREDVQITGSDEGFDYASVQSEIDDLGALAGIADAWRWSLLYGGALLIPVVNDGGRLDTPLILERVTKVTGLHVMESPYIQPSNFNPTLGSSAFRSPEFYNITVNFSNVPASRIHRSRVIRFDGVRVPPSRLTRQRDGWGPSILDRVIEELQNLGMSMGYTRNILHEISALTLKIDGLRKKMAGNEADKAEARGALESIKENFDVLHVLALDKNDELVEINRNVSGLCDVIEKFRDALVAVTDYPRTLLLGQQPGGLNANSDSEFRAWYAYVATHQKKIVRPAMNSVLGLVFAARKNRGLPVPTEWVVEFAPLWQEPEKEQAASYLARSQADQINVLNGVMAPDESRAGHVARGQIHPLESPADGSPEA